jgi:hypothetical protein
MNKMENISKNYKGFTVQEKDQHSRLYDELTDIEDRVARYVIAGEIVKDMREFDIGVWIPMNSLCGEKHTCEDCEDRQGCDTYYAEKSFQLLTDRFEEDWKEREYAKKEGL